MRYSPDWITTTAETGTNKPYNFYINICQAINYRGEDTSIPFNDSNAGVYQQDGVDLNKGWSLGQPTHQPFVEGKLIVRQVQLALVLRSRKRSLSTAPLALQTASS
jgi:hypothetical protein